MKFPDPPTDVRDAIDWFAGHADEVNADAPVQADIDHIFVMAHSAGAAIVASAFLLPNFFPDSLKPRIHGLILQGGAYHFQTKAVAIPPVTVSAYYGTEEDIKKNQPLSLLKNASEDEIRSLPEVVLYVSDFEVPAIRESCGDFRQLLSNRVGRPVEERIMKGHNHISPHVALYTGQGEEWANEVADWAKARVPK